METIVFPGRYVQGAHAFARLGKEMSRFGSKAFLICDPYVMDHLLSDVRWDIEKDIPLMVERFGGECSDEEIDRVVEAAAQSDCDVVAGMGGGKTVDTAKAVAGALKLPVAIAPTVASTDAPCSAVTIVYTPDGLVKRFIFHARNPDLVMMDTYVVAHAPVRFLVSGMGDALSTWFEADSCRQKYARNVARGHVSLAANALARLCYDMLLEYGLSAKLSCEAQVVTPALEHIVEVNTLLSGLGFESGGMAAAHSIHNGLTALPQTHAFYHGEKVAVGVLASLFLTDKAMEVIDEVYDFCTDVGLPTTLADIGLADVTDDELMQAAEAAMAKGETIHNEPIPITADGVFAALKMADAEGRDRKD